VVIFWQCVRMACLLYCDIVHASECVRCKVSCNVDLCSAVGVVRNVSDGRQFGTVWQYRTAESGSDGSFGEKYKHRGRWNRSGRVCVDPALGLFAIRCSFTLFRRRIDNNPAYYTFLLEQAWRAQPLPNVSTWLQAWGVQRCGRDSPRVRQAWAILAETVYAPASEQIYEHHMGYCPTTMPEGSGWDRQRGSERPKWYQRATLHQAWGLLIDATEAGECGSKGANDAMVFDIVDVGREYLSISACNDASDALTRATTPASVATANATMSDVMADIDTLLGSSFGFLLGPWIRDARAMAPSRPHLVDSQTKMATLDGDFLEWNARSQVTSWFPVDDCAISKPSLDGLWDYGTSVASHE
jgi:hypothetical protein